MTVDPISFLFTVGIACAIIGIVMSLVCRMPWVMLLAVFGGVLVLVSYGFENIQADTTVEPDGKPEVAGQSPPDPSPAITWQECADIALKKAMDGAQSYRVPVPRTIIQLNYDLAVCDRQFPEAYGP